MYLSAFTFTHLKINDGCIIFICVCIHTFVYVNCILPVSNVCNVIRNIFIKQNTLYEQSYFIVLIK